MNILEKITERTKERIEEEKKIVPLEEVRRQAEEKRQKKELKIKSQYSNRHFGQTDYPLSARQRKRHLPKN